MPGVLMLWPLAVASHTVLGRVVEVQVWLQNGAA